jgi:hypothetical protein
MSVSSVERVWIAQNDLGRNRILSSSLKSKHIRNIFISWSDHASIYNQQWSIQSNNKLSNMGVCAILARRPQAADRGRSGQNSRGMKTVKLRPCILASGGGTDCTCTGRERRRQKWLVSGAATANPHNSTYLRRKIRPIHCEITGVHSFQSRGATESRHELNDTKRTV